MRFTKSFNGSKAVIGDLELQIDKDFIAAAADLSYNSEKQFKHTPLKDVPWKQLLVNPVNPEKYAKGMLVTIFKLRWKNMLKPIFFFHYL